MKKGSVQLIFTSMNKEHAGMYICRTENMRNMSNKRDSKGNKSGKRHKPTNTHRVERKDLARGGGLLRRCDVTSAKRFKVILKYHKASTRG